MIYKFIKQFLCSHSILEENNDSSVNISRRIKCKKCYKSFLLVIPCSILREFEENIIMARNIDRNFKNG